MGSRAVVLALPRRRRPRGTASAASAAASVYTRTGRPFFDRRALDQRAADRVPRQLADAGLWAELGDRLAAAGLRAAALVG